MRFIDEIRTGHSKVTYLWDAARIEKLHSSPQHARGVAPIGMDIQTLTDIPVVMATNVIDLLNAKPLVMPIEDFPNALMPFPGMWIEYIGLKSTNSVYGCLLQRQAAPNGYTLRALLFVPDGNGIDVNTSVVFIVETDLVGTITSCRREDPNSDSHWLERGWTEAKIADLPIMVLRVPLMTLCLMNCRNVPVTWLPPPHKDQLKAFVKKTGKRPSIRVATINITPMSRLVSAAIDASKDQTQSGRHVAAHLYRGHFKTYTPEKPHFGKNVGTYFWQPGARGIKSTDTEKPKPKEYAINTKGIVVKSTSFWANKVKTSS